MNKILIFIFSAFLLSSCSETLVEKPKSLASENFYNTAAEVEAAVNAIYGPMRMDNGLSINYPSQLEARRRSACIRDWIIPILTGLV
jgi:hypothetical protein